MIIKIKKMHNKQILRTESRVEIKEILIKEEMMHPKEEKIMICFRGEENSGIIELSDEEIEKITKSVNKKTKLIKKTKIIK